MTRIQCHAIRMLLLFTFAGPVFAQDAQTEITQRDLDKVKAELENAKAESDRLRGVYDRNEEELERIHKSRLPAVRNIAEILGMSQALAQMQSERLHGSVLSYEMSGCLEFLNSLGDRSNRPRPNDTPEILRRMRDCHDRYLAHSTEVIRLDLPIATSDNNVSLERAIRVGTFTAVSDGYMLFWQADQRSFTRYDKLMAIPLKRAIRAFERVDSGTQPLWIDVTGGLLLRLLQNHVPP